MSGNPERPTRSGPVGGTRTRDNFSLAERSSDYLSHYRKVGTGGSRAVVDNMSG